MLNINDLQFVRVIDPAIFQVIPRKLFEQIKELDEEAIDAIYANAVSIMTIPVVNEKGIRIGTLPKLNVWVAILHDVAHQIKGFLWAEFDIIERCIFVQACSLDKQYQSNDGAFIKKVVEYLRGLPVPDELKANIRFATTRPEAFEKLGWKRSKKILLELKDESEKRGKQSISDNGVGGKTKPTDSKV